MSETIQLYDTQGRRLYLSSAEREAFLDAATQADRPIRTLCSVLYYTGCRISEAMALLLRRIDLHDQTIIFETLKKRRRGVYRAVPVPPSLIDTLDMVHGLREAHKRHNKAMLDAKLWPWSRVTAWRQVKAVMSDAAIRTVPTRVQRGCDMASPSMHCRKVCR